MSKLRRSLGAKVRQLRQAIGLTQEELAEKAGLSPKHLGELERGRANPTLSSLEALAAALGISIAALFDQEEAQLSPDGLKGVLHELIDHADSRKREFIYKIAKHYPKR